ncbi:hypothetical protein F5984_26010 [Rudanella paleaurantiibacter]|uniref:ParB/Sulfiredoxin domain-containing protein n=1 Tax=Rudanella paleaurantiibacter TaxID=2614655 RepID=A0A7J5TRX9_9BACT|nr:hypothetical protein [Rudanella paleaurantiibacter]KAB7725501.1 hypothetical protein F5984_26010 [Rudanella paleaurantiibacter]
MAKLDLKSAISKNVKSSLNNAFSSTENIKQHIVVLDELRSWIPEPTEEENKQLELNIVANGCRDALTLWETTQHEIDPDSTNPDEPAYVLVDGHNRYRICKARNISFNIQLMDFADLKSVKDFMIDLQLGRRNLTPQQIHYFRGLRYLNEKNQKGRYDRIEDEKPTAEAKVAKAKATSTAEKLAQEYNVGKNTIIRDSEFAAGVERLAPDLKKKVLSGAVKVDKGALQKVGKMPSEAAIASIEELESLAIGNQNKTETPVAEKKSTAKAKAQLELTGFMENLLSGKPLTRARLDQLILKANVLKELL